jgi:hypothetical protein
MNMLRQKQLAIGMLAVGALVAPGLSAEAAVISKWTFETNYTPPAAASTTAGPFLAEEGSFPATAAASSVHATAAAFTATAGNGSVKAFSANTYATGDYFQFTTPTTGFSNIQLLFDQTASGTGPTSWKVAFSTDGTNFTDLAGGAYTLNTTQSFSTTAERPTSPPRYLFDLSGIPALNNQPNITLRLIDTFPTGATAGTSRVDNVTIGTDLPVPAPLPEPGGAALFAIAIAGGLRRRRRRSA